MPEHPTLNACLGSSFSFHFSNYGSRLATIDCMLRHSPFGGEWAMRLSKKKTWTTHRYLEAPDEPSQVLGWLRSAGSRIEELPLPHGVAFHFKDYGELVAGDFGNVDVHRSPVVTVFVPHVRRGIIWTVGEVHFWATPLRQRYPPLYSLSQALRKWLRRFECVFANGHCQRPEWEYHLEGSIRNYDPPIFALPAALQALNSGRYFVDHRDNEHRLDTLCKALRLRGIQCADGGPPN
jgi:hypothetical protein